MGYIPICSHEFHRGISQQLVIQPLWKRWLRQLGWWHDIPNIWKDPPFLIGIPSISMGHLYHGKLLNNQRVIQMFQTTKQFSCGIFTSVHQLFHQKMVPLEPYKKSVNTVAGRRPRHIPSPSLRKRSSVRSHGPWLRWRMDPKGDVVP
jgi:hypothetical protein